MRTRSPLSSLRLLPFAACVLAACGPDAPPLAPANATTLRAGAANATTLASPAWQTLAATLVVQANFNPIVAGHAYPLLGVAEYRAVLRVEADHDDWTEADGPESGNGIGRGGRSRLESDRGAVAGASAVVLTYLFPTRAAQIEALVTEQANAGPGQVHPAFTAGEAIGRAVGAEVVARAMGDRFGTLANPAPTPGPGVWISNTTPYTVAGGQLPGVRPWFLTSANQFRPGPPPAYGSPEFLSALAEIRQLSETRTAEQSGIATYWALNNGTPTASGFWLQVATSKIIARDDISERRATHLYAVMSAAMFDAIIGCWDAKLTYWLIRPWQADARIAVLAAVGKPNHPSYPSGHSCVSSSGAAVLSAFFPSDRASLDAMVTEAGLSRMYGGIHYRFDCETGQVLGRNVAALALAADASGESVLTSAW